MPRPSNSAAAQARSHRIGAKHTASNADTNTRAVLTSTGEIGYFSRPKPTKSGRGPLARYQPRDENGCFISYAELGRHIRKVERRQRRAARDYLRRQRRQQIADETHLES
jgi:hypothetical protein